MNSFQNEFTRRAPRRAAPAPQSKEMPFKSQAQRRKFAQLLVEGKISNETFEEWNRETGGARLPERVADTRQARRKSAKKRAPVKGKARARPRRARGRR